MSESIAPASFISRAIILLYGIVSYFIGVAGLACIILALVKFIPFGFLNPGQTSVPIVWNLVLVALWGIVHTVMARDSFKAVLTKIVPEAAERPTYVLVAGITSVLLVGLWQPVGGVIWSVTNPTAAIAIWVVFVFGWIYLLASTFAINHFDLFGLRQVYLNYTNQIPTPLAFTKRAMYRFTRHPIQTGVLIGIWAVPVMTATHVLLSIGFTLYIIVGLWFEEKDLVKDIGAPYEQYRQETGKLFPKLIGRK
jgi:protein-S-isoprenylcysteine O-methyltransferase Ste14